MLRAKNNAYMFLLCQIRYGYHHTYAVTSNNEEDGKEEWVCSGQKSNYFIQCNMKLPKLVNLHCILHIYIACKPDPKDETPELFSQPKVRPRLFLSPSTHHMGAVWLSHTYHCKWQQLPLTNVFIPCVLPILK